MLIILVLAVIFCIFIVAFIFTRPPVPKKYPIFSIGDNIESLFVNASSQVNSIANDSLSLHSSHNDEAFSQIVNNTKTKFSQIKTELDKFDAYWNHFVKFKAQSSFVNICESYSVSRRGKIDSAEKLTNDAITFMKATNKIKQLRHSSNNIVSMASDPRFIDSLRSISTQTDNLYNEMQELRTSHPVTTQYRVYILEFLKKQLQLLQACENSGHDTTDILEAYNDYMNSWLDLNDSHVVDLVNDEFSWQIDEYQNAMDQLKRDTDYNS